MSDIEGAAAVIVPAPGGAPRHAERRDKPRSLAGDAWHDLRRNKIFWIAGILVVVVVLMAAFPTLFSSADPRACALSRKLLGASGSAPFGYDFQGCNVYARTIYGARASIEVGVLATLIS